MADIVQFRPRAAEERWIEGPALCLECRYQWHAVVPAGTWWLQCPSCETDKGRFQGPIIPGGEMWTCQCGNEMFMLQRNRFFCNRCGLGQSF